MNYYFFQQHRGIPDLPSVLRSPEGFKPEDWIDGERLPDPGNLKFVMSPRSGKFRGAIVSGLATLFHKKFIEQLKNLGVDNFQHFPIELENPEGEIETTYSLVNIIGLPEAVDKENSTIEPYAHGNGGKLYSFKIDPQKAGDLKMFRLKEKPTLIVIREDIYKGLIEINPDGLPGVQIVPTEEHDGWG